ncbi:hypothetical protein BDY21DRAFT_65996 [Lineolata rhizophorae]|uniref:Uncharacterized protein n=1 Tax=Lineolata rhizophorae TaxID=578093 RepID=A0A6A6NUI3_9PEZI|nr:hypothetical protein BDY21DRAFT_65996 [Lineolata rhizophorae]
MLPATNGLLPSIFTDPLLHVKTTRISEMLMDPLAPREAPEALAKRKQQAAILGGMSTEVPAGPIAEARSPTWAWHLLNLRQDISSERRPRRTASAEMRPTRPSRTLARSVIAPHLTARPIRARWSRGCDGPQHGALSRCGYSSCVFASFRDCLPQAHIKRLCLDLPRLTGDAFAKLRQAKLGPF